MEIDLEWGSYRVHNPVFQNLKFFISQVDLFSCENISKRYFLLKGQSDDGHLLSGICYLALMCSVTDIWVARNLRYKENDAVMELKLHLHFHSSIIFFNLAGACLLSIYSIPSRPWDIDVNREHLPLGIHCKTGRWHYWQNIFSYNNFVPWWCDYVLHLFVL